MIHYCIHYSVSRRSLLPLICPEVVAGRSPLLFDSLFMAMPSPPASRSAPFLLLMAACLLVAPVTAQEKADPVEDLIRQLRSPNYNLRYDAAGRLAQLGPKAREAVPALTVALKDPEA